MVTRIIHYNTALYLTIGYSTVHSNAIRPNYPSEALKVACFEPPDLDLASHLVENSQPLGLAVDHVAVVPTAV